MSNDINRQSTGLEWSIGADFLLPLAERIRAAVDEMPADRHFTEPRFQRLTFLLRIFRKEITPLPNVLDADFYDQPEQLDAATARLWIRTNKGATVETEFRKRCRLLTKMVRGLACGWPEFKETYEDLIDATESDGAPFYDINGPDTPMIVKTFITQCDLLLGLRVRVSACHSADYVDLLRHHTFLGYRLQSLKDFASRDASVGAKALDFAEYLEQLTTVLDPRARQRGWDIAARSAASITEAHRAFKLAMEGARGKATEPVEPPERLQPPQSIEVMLLLHKHGSLTQTEVSKCLGNDDQKASGQIKGKIMGPEGSLRSHDPPMIEKNGTGGGFRLTPAGRDWCNAVIEQRPEWASDALSRLRK